jgi:Leucine-rich repeat (LRR) protein
MEIIKYADFKVLHLTDGKEILDAVKLINKGKAQGINFNFVYHFPPNIDEIKLAPDIKYIQLNDYSWNFDYSAINLLTKMESLSIYTTDKKEINYFNFPALKSTAIYWRPKANSLFQCGNLEHLFIGKYNGLDLSKFEALKKLKWLRINTGSIRSLKGIEKLSQIDTLLLCQATKLEDISGIESLPKLQFVRIDNCRNIKNIHILKQLTGATKMDICGTTPRL